MNQDLSDFYLINVLRAALAWEREAMEAHTVCRCRVCDTLRTAVEAYRKIGSPDVPQG